MKRFILLHRAHEVGPEFVLLNRAHTNAQTVHTWMIVCRTVRFSLRKLVQTHLTTMEWT